MKNTFFRVVGIVLVSAFLVKCGGNSSAPNTPVVVPPSVNPSAPQPVTPVTPTVPPVSTAKGRGFIRPTGGGVISGAPFQLADLQAALPQKFSWKAENYDIPVRDQGQCGSCYAHASEEAFEWSFLIFEGVKEQFSVEQIISCSTANYGCSGGYFEGDYLKNTGLTLESSLPYTGRAETCPANLAIAEKAYDAVNIGTGSAAPTVVQLKEALLEYGPLAVSVAADSSWDSYQGGIKTSCSGTSIDHMVVIYGWDDTQSKSGIWYVRNSWGSSWGENGDILLPYGCDSIGSDAGAVLAKPVATLKLKRR